MIKKIVSTIIAFCLLIGMSIPTTMAVMAGELETDMPADNNDVAEQIADGVSNDAEDSVRTHRDELEREQLIAYDPVRQEELSGIVTDLNREADAISSMGKEVLSFLSNAESYNALNIVLSEAWFSTMLTEDLVIGQRNYHLDTEGMSGDIMVVSDELGNQYTYIRSYTDTYGMCYLEVSPETIRFMVLNDPSADSYFVVQTLYTSDGTFLSNEGFVTEEHLMIDNFTVYMSDMVLATESDAEGDEESNSQGFSLVEAWAHRYDSGLTYQGSFDEMGRTLVETPQEQAEQGQLCYALQERTQDTLYLYIEDTPEHAFTGEEFGVFTVWDSDNDNE